MDFIISLLNEWDPIGLLPFAPSDEYIVETIRIYDYINNNSSVSIDDLASKINDIFIYSFGKDVYSEDYQACKKIAKKILDHIN